MDRTGRTRELIRLFPHMKPLVAPAHLDYAECRPTVLATGKEKDMRRARHQKGSLQRVKRKSGESVWMFRWYEVQLDGTKCYRKAVIGSISEYKTEAEAQKAADALRLEINEQTPRQQLRAISIETLVEHYRLHELPDIGCQSDLLDHL